VSKLEKLQPWEPVLQERENQLILGSKGTTWETQQKVASPQGNLDHGPLSLRAGATLETHH